LTEKSKLAGNHAGRPNEADPLRTDVRAGPIEGMQRCLAAIAGFPNEQNEGGDHGKHDEHPVLYLEAQNGEMLDQKLHFPRLLCGHDKRFGGGNILFLYF
jgi:hypothetical protein